MRGKRKPPLWSGARNGTAVLVFGLSTAVVMLAAGCAGVAQDPERLSEAVARATYERDTGLLYDHASPALRAYNQTAEDRSEGMFAQTVTNGLDRDILEGEIEAEGAQRAPVMLEMEGLSFYDVPAVDPDGRQVTINVALIEDEGGSYTYCAVSVRDPGDSLTYSDSFEWLVGGEDTCGA